MADDKRFELKKERETRAKNKNITETADIEGMFRQTSHINKQIETKIEEIAYWRNLATKASAIFSEINTGGTRKNRSRVEDCVCKITDIEDSLKVDMDELIELKQRTMRIIEKMDIPEYKSLLIHRYICDKTWFEVADSMGYSYVHTVNRLHPKALKRIREIGAEK